jgi:tetratricopeptide (TPR) repeat protein
MGVHAPGDVLGWYVGGPEQMREMGMNATRNTTDLPIIEFSAPKAVALSGVSATMPAVLTAFDRVSPYDLRTQLDGLCAQSIDAQTLYDAANARRVGRWLARGQLLYSYNYPDQYLRSVQQAYSLRPNDRFVRRTLADAQFSVAEQHVNDGYPRDAYPLYCDSYLNDSTSAMALVSAVKAAIQAGEKTLADQALKLVVEEHEAVFDVLVYRGYIELEFANYAEARAALERAAALDQESPTMHVCLGSLDLRDGSRESAHGHFDRALEISTTALHTAYDIVDMCHEGGFVTDALPYAKLLVRLATRAIAGDPAEPYLYGYRALGYSVLGENRLAARDMAAKRSLLDWWQAEPEIEQPETIPLMPKPIDTAPPL